MKQGMELPTHDELIERIDTFLKRHGMAESRLGRDAVGEAQIISDIRKGRSPRLSTLEKLANFMAERDGALDREERDAA